MELAYLTPAQVCELIPGITVRTLAEMRARRRAGIRGPKAGPVYAQPARTVIVYSRSDVLAYLREISL